jgi:GNAT superfamily N-acetyltransferase
MVFWREDMHLAAPDDLEQIIGLLEDSAAWMVSIGIHRWPPGTFVASGAQLRSAIEAATVYVWKVRGRVWGTIRLTESDASIWGTDDAAALYIHKMSVQRSLKGGGFGKALVHWAEEVAVTRGRSVLRLDCWAENPRLCAFYESCGFRRIRTLLVQGWLHQLFEKDVRAEALCAARP